MKRMIRLFWWWIGTFPSGVSALFPFHPKLGHRLPRTTTVLAPHWLFFPTPTTSICCLRGLKASLVRWWLYGVVSFTYMICSSWYDRLMGMCLASRPCRWPVWPPSLISPLFSYHTCPSYLPARSVLCLAQRTIYVCTIHTKRSTFRYFAFCDFYSFCAIIEALLVTRVFMSPDHGPLFLSHVGIFAACGLW